MGIARRGAWEENSRWYRDSNGKVAGKLREPTGLSQKGAWPPRLVFSPHTWRGGIACDVPRTREPVGTREGCLI